jgi:hypothetical protein
MTDRNPSAVGEAVKHIGAAFRHLVPGALILLAVVESQPSWLSWVDLNSPRHLIVLAVVAITVGNAWYVLNRYVFHQAIDAVMYALKWPGPARVDKPHYHGDLAKWVHDAFDGAPASAQAGRVHVATRAASVLLIYTVGQLLVLMAWCSDPSAPAAHHETAFTIIGVAVLACGWWQNVITRRIDAAVLHRESPR